MSEGTALVAVDWGTTHLRIWTLDANGAVLAERRSDEGMGATARDRFEAVLERHLADLAVTPDIPVVMCGMVGSRQGWAEAGYLPIPVSLAEIPGRAVRVAASRRDVRILPGLSKSGPAAPDVMRSEETQLLGIDHLSPVAETHPRVVCMPGTHSKWVSMTGSTVTDFASFMTGDLYAAAANHSVLRHSLTAGPVDPQSAAFREAVRASLDSPADLLARLFSIRPAGLLRDLAPVEARARLSGYLIGQEIAGALARFDIPDEIDLVGGSLSGALYVEALAAAGIACTVHDGEAAAIAGLAHAAKAIWGGGSAR